MPMTQRKRFLRPVFKASSDELIEPGDTAILILKDGSASGVTLTGVQDRAYWIEWDNSGNSIRVEDVRAMPAQHFLPCEDLEDTGNFWLDINGNPILDINGNPIPILA